MDSSCFQRLTFPLLSPMLLCGHGRIEEVFITDLFFSKNMQVYVSMWLQIPLKIGGVFDVIKCVKKSGRGLQIHSTCHSVVKTCCHMLLQAYDPHSNHGPKYVFLSLHLRLCPYCRMFPTCRSGYCSHVWLPFIDCRLGPSSTKDALRKAVVELSTVFFFSSIFSAMQVSRPPSATEGDLLTTHVCLSIVCRLAGCTPCHDTLDC